MLAKASSLTLIKIVGSSRVLSGLVGVPVRGETQIRDLGMKFEILGKFEILENVTCLSVFQHSRNKFEIREEIRDFKFSNLCAAICTGALQRLAVAGGISPRVREYTWRASFAREISMRACSSMLRKCTCTRAFRRQGEQADEKACKPMGKASNTFIRMVA